MKKRKQFDTLWFIAQENFEMFGMSTPVPPSTVLKYITAELWHKLSSKLKYPIEDNLDCVLKDFDEDV